MGYYIRVLGSDPNPIEVEVLRAAAAPAVLEVEEEVDGIWNQLTLKHPSQEEIAIIERNIVAEGQLGADELQEFQDEVAEYKPASSAAWLKTYLPTVTVIYAFQLLDATDVEGGWEAVHRVHAAVWKATGGILQADGEGFSNEAGYTILWQFSDRVSGEWNAAIIDASGRWTNFRMDLGDLAQRQAFLRGEVPDGAKIL